MISVKNIIKDIRSGKYIPVYLLLGSENYLRDSIFKTICHEYLGEESISAGLHRLDGTPSALKQSLSQMNMPVLFSKGLRIFLIDDPLYLKMTKEKDKNKKDKGTKKKDSKGSGGEINVQALIKEFWDKYENETPDNLDNIIIFRATNTDKRIGLYKMLEKLNAVIDCSPLKREELKAWVKSKLKNKNISIEPEALEKLILSTDGDMLRIEQEIEKISNYLDNDEKMITGEIVEKLVFGNPQANIFRLVDAVGEGNTGQAWREIQSLFMLNEHPLKILTMVVRQFRLILEMRSLKDGGCPPGQAASRLKVAPFVARKLEQQARHYDKEELRQIFSILLKTDHDIKTGKIDSRLAMEILISRLTEMGV